MKLWIILIAGLTLTACTQHTYVCNRDQAWDKFGTYEDNCNVQQPPTRSPRPPRDHDNPPPVVTTPGEPGTPDKPVIPTEPPKPQPPVPPRPPKPEPPVKPPVQPPEPPKPPQPPKPPHEPPSHPPKPPVEPPSCDPKPGWGHGDDNHNHSGPPGHDKGKDK